MKLAEALARRADIQRRMSEVQSRFAAIARVQEGDVLDEDPAELLAEFDRLNGELTKLVVAINQVNSTTAFDESHSIADAIALRDAARREQSFYLAMAQQAGQRVDRYSRSEIKLVAPYPVAQLRRRADAAAQRFRELDTRLQEKNWTTEMPE